MLRREKKPSDTSWDLFLKFSSEEKKTEILPIVKGIARWDKYSSTVIRGFSKLKKEELESLLYQESHYTKDDVEVMDANNDLFWIMH